MCNHECVCARARCPCPQLMEGANAIWTWTPGTYDASRQYSLFVHDDESVTMLRDSIDIAHNDGIDVARFRVRAVCVSPWLKQRECKARVCARACGRCERRGLLCCALPACLRVCVHAPRHGPSPCVCVCGSESRCPLLRFPCLPASWPPLHLSRPCPLCIFLSC